jgi:hypothetical protein
VGFILRTVGEDNYRIGEAGARPCGRYFAGADIEDFWTATAESGAHVFPARADAEAAAKMYGCPPVRVFEVVEVPTADCGSNSCRYVAVVGGMRVNGPCSCDECPACGASVPAWGPERAHRGWCGNKQWTGPKILPRGAPTDTQLR